MEAKVKQEIKPLRTPSNLRQNGFQVKSQKEGTPTAVINLDSSSSGSSGSSSDSDESDAENYGVSKRRKLDNLGALLPAGFLAPLAKAPSQTPPSPRVLAAVPVENRSQESFNARGIRQFWRAGDFEGVPSVDWGSRPDGGDRMDHVRVHPKFLHSNATSHKWALGAFAELLDNALDEYASGARYVNVDVIQSRKDRTKMLLIEDNGGGMDPERMRQCMSLGYSAKSKIANTIGQYGNGFKTSTMRLGADVIVFSRCPGKDGKSSTQSIGLLSYTFLRSTGKEDIVVPMLDYEYVRDRLEWNKIIRFSSDAWNRNVETIVQWSPFSNEADLLSQFNKMSDHGTRIIIYNLWEDDQGLLELDFDSDPHDIQLRGVNRDEKNIQMAKQFPNSKHFLTYRHSLRSYTAILYLRLPAGFRIILRGKDVDHHNIVNDMMLSERITYRPQYGADGVVKDNMTVAVTVGFVKDAKQHIDLQGFNVYHKNRLIKPFWRLWNSASSQGRGVIGVLEANFVEPAHDKQSFERTTVLSRLEARLVQMQKNYWSKNCHHIGYSSARSKKLRNDSGERESSPDYHPSSSSPAQEKYNASSSKVSPACSGQRNQNGNASSKGNNRARTRSTGTVSSEEDVSDVDMHIGKKQRARRSNQKASGGKEFSGKDGLHASQSVSCSEDIEPLQNLMPAEESIQPATESMSKNLDKYDSVLAQTDLCTINHLKQENHELKERLEKWERESQCQLMLKCERCDSLEMQLKEVQQKVEELGKERDDLLNVISEERINRDEEEEKLRMKLKTASNTIQELLDKVKLLEKMKSRNSRA